MAEIDPETEALLRKLHKELNGPPLRSRRGSVPHKGHLKGLAGEGDRRPRKASHSDDEAASSTGDEDEEREAKRSRKDHGGESRLHGKPPKQASPGSITPRTDCSSKTPIDAAAAASAAHVREKLQASSSLATAAGISGGGSGGGGSAAGPASGSIKAFHAGVRWGITLQRDALKSRADLATQLNDAFAGEILSCGRGEKLCIVFLDCKGGMTEFPPLRTHDARDSGSQWKASVERARKVYVRRG